DDAADVLEALIEKRVAQAAARVREQRLYRPAAARCIELLDAAARGEIRLERVDRRARRPQGLGRVVDRRLVGRDEQVETVLGAAFRELEADAARRARDRRQRT